MASRREGDKLQVPIAEYNHVVRLQADLALNLLPVLPRLSLPNANDLLRQIMDQLFHEPDRTRFGLTNAVTAVGRDTRDPETRRRLEELGGAIAAGIVPTPPSFNPGMKKPRRRSVAGV